MKRSILPLLLGAAFWILSSFSATAQDDIKMSRIIYPENNQRVHLLFTYNFEFSIVNFGNNPIPYSSIKFDFLYDKQYWRTEGMSTTGTLNPGDSINVIIPGLSIASTNPTIEICIVSALPGDFDPTNDTICTLLEFSLDNFVDFSPVLVRVVDPVIADSNFATGTKLLELEGYIKNVGNVTLPKDYTVLMRYSLYNKNRTFAGNTTSPLDPGEVLVITMKGGLPTVQNAPGPFDICLNILNGDDQNPNNDQYCQVFYANDYTGIDVHNSDEFKTYVYNDKLNIVKPDGSENIQVRIHNSLGQQVYLQTLNSSEKIVSINLENLHKGIYIIDISNNRGQSLHVDKFALD